MGKILITISVILSLIGAVTFSQFIMQEAYQTTQWALHADPTLAQQARILSNRILRRMKIVNYFAWPYARQSYKRYIEQRYIDTEERSADKGGPPAT